MNDSHDDAEKPHVHGPDCNHGHHHHHAAQEPARKEERPGRNEPCWCGSGTKYKKCHARTDNA